MKIIFDCSPLVALIEVLKLNSKINKLNSLGFELIIPKRVFEEFKEKNSNDLSFLKKSFKIKKVKVLDKLIPSLNKDSGELEVISLALKMKNNGEEYICIIDEDYGRKVAKEIYQLNCMGVIGFLINLQKFNLISSQKMKGHYKKLKESNFRVKKEHLNLLLKKHKIGKDYRITTF